MEDGMSNPVASLAANLRIKQQNECVAQAHLLRSSGRPRQGDVEMTTFSKSISAARDSVSGLEQLNPFAKTMITKRISAHGDCIPGWMHKELRIWLGFLSEIQHSKTLFLHRISNLLKIDNEN